MPGDVNINVNIHNSTLEALSEITASINIGEYDNTFGILYPQREIAECRARYLDLIGRFTECFIDGAAAAGDLTPGAHQKNRVIFISAPGRTEICGNHTDHQHGNVLAAAIDLDIICAAALNNSNYIRIYSAGHQGIDINIGELSPREVERGHAASLIRGLAAWFAGRGAKLCGFDAYTTSQVLVGSGLSSSAAFEVAVGAIMNTLFGAGVSPTDIAIAGQFAENQYFGKPSGLMDQTASSVGGFVKIDFDDPKNPIVEPIQYDLTANGLRLCVVNTKGNHADLIAEYASIPEEMRAVASFFGKSYLRDVDEWQFNEKLADVREALHRMNPGAAAVTSGAGNDAAAATSDTANDAAAVAAAAAESIAGASPPVAPDRALLRAIHFFRENKLVSEAAGALRSADIDIFLECLVRSGQSSFTYLQNIFAVAQPGEQGLSIALALSESLLRGNGGAWRVTGGGFAGTIMALVPAQLHERFKNTLEAVFGEGSCLTLSIRKFGGIEVTPRLTDKTIR